MDRAGDEYGNAAYGQSVPEPTGVRRERNNEGRGTFYRLQTDGFDSLQVAASVCMTSHAGKQPRVALKRSGV